MHHQNNKIDILCFGGNDFNNSLDELKEHLNFNLSFLKGNKVADNFDMILIHESMLKDKNVLKLVNTINVIKMLVSKPEYSSDFRCDDKINLPLDINELNKKVIELNTKKKFSLNSSIQIKIIIFHQCMI